MEDTTVENEDRFAPLQPYNYAVGEVTTELWGALTKFPNFRSTHEGLAIIEEEFLELREEIFWGKKKATVGGVVARYNEETKILEAINYDEIHRTRIKKEAIQLAAMAIRLIAELDKLPS